MAKGNTYTLAEVAKIIKEGDNLYEVLAVTRYYPLLVALLAPLAAKAGDELMRLMDHFPEHVTASKIHRQIKEAVEVPDEDRDGDDVPAKPKAAVAKAGGSGYKRVTPGEGPYAGMKSMSLYKMAKDRGLQPEIRQTAAYYIALLEKDDAKKGGKKAGKPVPVEVDEDDDEDDVPAPKKAPAKKPAKPAPVEDDDEDEEDEPPVKKGKAKAKKPVDDEDDDWDI